MTDPTKLAPEGASPRVANLEDGRAAIAARAERDRLVSLGIIDQAGKRARKRPTSTPDNGQDGGGW